MTTIIEYAAGKRNKITLLNTRSRERVNIIKTRMNVQVPAVKILCARGLS